MDEPNIVLVCPGGANEGVFGGGVLTALDEAGVRAGTNTRIRAAYGASAGVLNLSFWFAGQARYGSQIYLGGHLDRRFIRPEYVPLGIYQRAVHKYVRQRQLHERVKPVDIDYLFDEVLAQRVPLDISRLEDSLQHTDFKILLGDPHKATANYVDARGDTLAKLKAATALIPYYNQAVTIGSYERIDGTLIEPTGIREVARELRPTDKLVVIMNYRLERGTRHHLKDHLEAWVASLMFDGDLARVMRDRVKKFRTDVSFIEQQENCLLVYPSTAHITPSTTNPKKLQQLFNHGLEKGEELAKLLL